MGLLDKFKKKNIAANTSKAASDDFSGDNGPFEPEEDLSLSVISSLSSENAMEEMSEEQMKAMTRKMSALSNSDLLRSELERAMDDEAPENLDMNNLDGEISKLLELEAYAEPLDPEPLHFPMSFEDYHDPDKIEDAESEEPAETASEQPEYKKKKRGFLRKKGGGEKHVSTGVAIINGTPKKLMLIITGTFGLLVIASGVFFATNLMKYYELKNAPTQAPETLPAVKSAANNANYIYLNMSKQAGSSALRLTRMVTDSMATVFYFDKAFDPEEFDIILSDSAGNAYALDRSFRDYDRGANTKMTLRFEPLQAGSTGFSLRMTERASKESIDFSFAFEEGIEYPPARVTKEEIEVFSDGEMSLTVERASFSSSGSVFEYSLEWGGDLDGVYFDGENQCLKLTDTYGTVLPVRNEPLSAEYPESGITLGRMDFNPVNNLNGTVELTFSNMYMMLNTKTDINASSLSWEPKKNPNPIIVTRGAYDIVLEHLGVQNGIIVVVMHTENRLYEGEITENGMENRVENKISAKMQVNFPNGKIEIVPATVYTKRIGCDLVFNLQELIKLNGTAQLSDMTIKLGESQITLPEKSVKIKLSELSQEPAEADAAARTSLVTAFNSRLACKSGEITQDMINGFSQEVFSDTELAKSYTQENLTEGASYSSHPVLFSRRSGIIRSLVQETWTGSGPSGNLYHSGLHQIEARIEGENVIIHKDIMIN